MFRYLRIIASVGCVLACVAFFVLWLWSYGCDVSLHGSLSDKRVFQLASVRGRLSFLTLPANPKQGIGPWPLIPLDDHKSHAGATPIPHDYAIITPSNWRWLRYVRSQGAHTALGFSASSGPQAFWLIVPYWFLLLASGSSALIVQQRSLQQFNLRSLFIVMTLLAVVFAMISLLDISWIGK